MKALAKVLQNVMKCVVNVPVEVLDSLIQGSGTRAYW